MRLAKDVPQRDVDGGPGGVVAHGASQHRLNPLAGEGIGADEGRPEPVEDGGPDRSLRLPVGVGAGDCLGVADDPFVGGDADKDVVSHVDLAAGEAQRRRVRDLVGDGLDAGDLHPSILVEPRSESEIRAAEGDSEPVDMNHKWEEGAGRRRRVGFGGFLCHRGDVGEELADDGGAVAGPPGQGQGDVRGTAGQRPVDGAGDLEMTDRPGDEGDTHAGGDETDQSGRLAALLDDAGRNPALRQASSTASCITERKCDG